MLFVKPFFHFKVWFEQINFRGIKLEIYLEIFDINLFGGNMLSVIGTIGYGIGMNLISNFIQDKVLKADDLNKIEKIHTVIGDFNRKFDNTVLDSKAFEEFIQANNIFDKIYCNLIRSFEKDFQSINEFKNSLASDALSYVNSKYIKNERNIISDITLFYEYFDELVDEIIEIRNNVLKLSESIMLSIITETVERSNDMQTQKIFEYLDLKTEDNFFADERILEVERFVDLYKFEDAKKEIDICLQEQLSLSNNQRERILYQEARILINTHSFDKIEGIIKRICKINSDSKYLDEIEFHVACFKNDRFRLNKVIQKFKDRHYSDEIILIRMAHFDVVNNDLVSVENLICPNLIMGKELIELDEAHFLFGIILGSKYEFNKSIIHFQKAFEIRQNIIYHYNSLLIMYFAFFSSSKSRFNYNQHELLKIENLLNEFEKVEYLIDYLDEDERVRYWSIIADLMMIIDREKALNIVDKINRNFHNNKKILGVVSSIYVANAKYDLAQGILINIFDDLPINMINLFIILESKNEWSELIRIFEGVENIDFTENPILLSYYFKAKSLTFGFESIKDNLIERMEQYYKFVSLVNRFIELTLENSDEVNFRKIFNIILKHETEFSTDELSFLCKSLSTHNRYKEIRILLIERIEVNEIAMNDFLKTFDDSTDEHLEDNLLYEKINQIYSRKCIFKPFLLFKAKIEITRKLYKKAMKTLECFIKYHDIDLNYAYMYVFSSINLKKYSCLEVQSEYLLKSSNQNMIQLVALLYSRQGKKEDAERLILKALFMTPNNLSKEFLINFVNMNLQNVHDKMDCKTFSKVKLDTVVTLKSFESLRYIAIHRDSYIYDKSGVVIFDCENYGPNDRVSLILMLSNGPGDKVNIEGIEYEINNIETIYDFFSKLCFKKLFSEFPDQEIIKPILANDTEEALEKIKNELSKYTNDKKRILDLYNFKIESGIPLSFFSNGSIDNYADVIISFLNMEKQHLFAGEMNIVNCNEFVLTLSTIIVLTSFDLLSKLKHIKGKITITDDVYQSLILGAKETSEFGEALFGYLNISDQDRLVGHEYSITDKKNKREFWSKIIQAIEELKPTIAKIDIDDHDIFDEHPEIWHLGDISSIELSSKTSKVFVCDDLFVRKTLIYISPNSIHTNTIGFLLSSLDFTLSEMIDLLMQTTKKKYLYPLNAEILYKITELIHHESDDICKKEYINRMKEIYANMFDITSKEYYMKINQDFLNLAFKENTNLEIVLEIIRDSLNLDYLNY